MRHAKLIITILIALSLAVGCKPAAEKAAEEQQASEAAVVQQQANDAAVMRQQDEIAEAQLDDAKTETKEAAQAVEDYSFAKKADFIAAMKNELAVMEQELDRLSRKADQSTGAAKADARQKLDEVRRQWIQTKKHLDQAENATESTWDDVKGGFGKAYGDLKDSFQSTRQWLSDKIEP
ncbi:MAG: hypothetical protein HZB23_10675 [Deltaproteobacteria bacterium]|nr:hypothetical protein [Deltaproteobacteria bacterium]